MKRIQRFFPFLFLVFLFQTVSAQASTLVINPVDTGSLYTCVGCNPNPNRSYLLVSGYIVGEVDFPTSAFQGQVGTALLSVNPYALPLFGPQINVYGRASNSPLISITDLASPTYIGTWTLPPGLGYGEDAFFDVSAFLNGVQTPYVDFILYSSDTDVFSSLQNNYGHPSQLAVNTVPEPSSAVLLLVGLAAPLSRFMRPRKIKAKLIAIAG